MPNIHCPVENCQYATGDVDNAVAAALLMAHTAGSHSANRLEQPRRPRPPKVDRPQLKDNISEETWNAFTYSWDIFVRANDVDDADQTVQLYSCCDLALKSKITAVHHDVLNQPVQQLLALLKTITVIPVAVTIKRNELLQMNQDAGETIRTFLSRVKAKAVTCRFKKECMHQHAPGNAQQPPDHVYVDYTSEMIRHVILNGLYDEEIKRDVFGQNNLDNMDVGDLVSLIEGKETARDATSSASTSAVSQFKKRQKDHVNVDYNRKEKCRTCGSSFNVHRKLYNGRPNKIPFVDCQDCWKKNNACGKYENTKESNDTQTKDGSAITFSISVTQEAQQIVHEESNMTMGETKTISSENKQQVAVENQSVETVEHINFNSSNMSRVPLPTVLRHHVFSNGNWKLQLAQAHPIVNLTGSTNISDYNEFGLTNSTFSGQKNTQSF